ncbi:MAG: cell division protein FtsZ [Candidatus Kaiserbacteria bacterium]|nr:cell division protein FtsZ [Candidatus Kaiserbacteria bacterium]
MTKQVKPDVESFARIRVIGVGGSGGNAVNHMLSSHVQGVDFITVNTDAQDLHKSKAKRKIHIGKALTRGLGTGMNADMGRQAADETREEIQDAVKGSDMVFITCGMGGGTGTGAAPVVAKIAREIGALTVGVVTRPFGFEGAQRMRLAEQGMTELRKAVDALIVIPNDKLLSIVSRETGIKNAFAMCDDILKQAVEGISDLITTTGIINVDFADVRTIMQNTGSALMGIGTATGEKRAELAARNAINSPLLEVSINGAKGVLFSIAGGDDLGMLEVQDAANVITEAIDPDAKVIFGAVTDSTLKKGEVRVTVIATGFPEGIRTSLFPASSRLAAKKDKDVAPVSPSLMMEDDSRDEDKDADKNTHFKKSEKLVKDAPKHTTPVAGAVAGAEEDDETWGGLPSFLRRK